MTVGAWLDIWLKEYTADIKPATLHSYKGRVENRIKPSIGALKLSALKPHTVQSFYNALQRGEKSRKALSLIHGILHKALEQAIELGYMGANPTKACKLPRVEKAEIKAIDSEQITAFLNAIKGHKFETFYIDVDFQAGAIKISK